MLIRPQAVIFVLGGVVVNRAAAGFRSIVAPPASATCDKFVHCVDGNEVFLNGTETGVSCQTACATAGGVIPSCCIQANDCDERTRDSLFCTPARLLSFLVVSDLTVPK